MALPSREIDNFIPNLLVKLNNIANKTIKPNPHHQCRKISWRVDLGRDYTGCDEKWITQSTCAGQCSSLFFPDHNTAHSSCSYCKVTKRRIRTVKLHCYTGVRRIKVAIVDECGCNSCRVANNIPEPPWKRKKRSKRFHQRKKEKMKKIALKRLQKKTKNKLKRNKKNRNNKKSRRRKKKKNRKMSRKKNRTSKEKKRNKKKNKSVITNSSRFTYDDMTRLLFSFTKRRKRRDALLK